MTVEVRLHGDAGTETLEFDAAAADRLVRPTSLELLSTVASVVSTSRCDMVDRASVFTSPGVA